MSTFENVRVTDCECLFMEKYIERVCERLGIFDWDGFVDIEFVDNLSNGATGYCDGDENMANISIAYYFEGERISTKQMMINIAHELIHAKQLLTGRLVHHGLKIDESSEIGLKYVYEFDKKEYTNIPYMQQPWEIEAYGNERKLYEECR